MNPKLTLALAGTALALYAAESWTNKDYTQWTREDAQKVLSNSPWARETTTAMSESGPGIPGVGSAESGGRGGMGGGGMGGGGGAGGGGGGRGGMGGGEGMGGGGRGGRGGGQGGMGGGMMQPQKVTIRWESALPVKEALLKAQFGDKLPAPGDPAFTLDRVEKDYVIAVTGLQMPMMGGGARRWPESGPDNGDAANAAARDEQRQKMQPQMRDRMMHAAQLVRKGKDPIYPTDMKLENANGTPVILFHFPKSDAISADDKEVKFVCQMGPMKVERKFTLKEMVFNGKLEL